MKNVVLFVVDTLRADHLGCYGYRKNTTPYLDELAAESVVFEAAFAPGIPTTPSFTTLMTGTHPYHHGVVAHSGDKLLPPEYSMMAHHARAAGLTTIAVDNLVVQGNGRGAWFSRGFDFYSAYIYKPFGSQVEEICDRAIRFIDEYSERPFFLFVHLWEPHTPYGPPAPYDTLHYDPADEKLYTPMRDVYALAPEYYRAFLGDMNFARPDEYSWIMAQYDGEISRADAEIGRVISHIKARGLWDNTTFIAMGDHGEAFGEGDFHFDHHGLYDAVMRVPLIWREPDAQATRRAHIVSTEDILPTLQETHGWNNFVSTQNATHQTSDRSDVLPIYSGRSFAPLFDKNAAQGFEERAEIIGVESTRQASLCWRTRDWKLILPITHDAHGEPIPDFYGNPRNPQPLLYDLKNDPAETRNVAAEYSDVRDELLEKLQSWRKQQVTQRGGDDPVLGGLGLPFDYFMERVGKRAQKAK